MFRATAKKRNLKKTVTRLRSNSDDEGESKGTSNTDKSEKSSPFKTRAVKKKKKGLVVRSFELGEGEEEEDPVPNDTSTHQSKNSKNRKRKLGLGFGGANLAIPNDDTPQPIGADDGVANAYGKEALENLKREQKFKAPPAAEEEILTSHSMPPPPMEEERSSGLGEYVSLNANQPSLILTGDEALDFGNHNSASEPSNWGTSIGEEAQDPQQEAETLAWETAITRRAGIEYNNPSLGYHGREVKAATTPITGSSVLSLNKLRDQIQATISQLQSQENDVDRACERHRVELSLTKDELERQEQELAASGKALEHYQQLREQLTFWTGALRDLKSKVKSIQEALNDLDAEISKCPQWPEWEDDMCAVLHQAGMLDRVLGRQPPDFVFEDTTIYVDEFGRDVKSQHSMGREKRMLRRMTIQQTRRQPMEDDDSDAGITDDDIETFRERRSALAKALEIAKQELDEEYTHLPLLALVFHEWQESHPEDFKECFANLSFGDLASVLVQSDLCKLRSSSQSYQGWLERSNGNQNSDLFAWIGELAQPDGTLKNNATPTNIPSQDLVVRIIDKSYIPLLSAILDKAAYSVVSKAQSKGLSTLYGKLSELNMNKSNPLLDALSRKLHGYLKTSLENIAIVILKGELEEDTQSQPKQELNYALRGAVEGQLRRVTKILVNVVTYWAPYLTDESGSDVVEFLLDFLSTTYLFLLSSLKTRSGITKESFARVWEVVRETGWLDQQGRMWQAAPLRAAASVYIMS